MPSSSTDQLIMFGACNKFCRQLKIETKLITFRDLLTNGNYPHFDNLSMQFDISWKIVNHVHTLIVGVLCHVMFSNIML